MRKIKRKTKRQNKQKQRNFEIRKIDMGGGKLKSTNVKWRKYVPIRLGMSFSGEIKERNVLGVVKGQAASRVLLAYFYISAHNYSMPIEQSILHLQKTG